MIKKHNISKFTIFYFFLSILLNTTFLNAQNRILVWVDEFNDSIDYSAWDYDLGFSGDNLQYYTIRAQNVQVVDSVLNIIVLDELYMGFNYTSACLKTKLNWKYGRFEALIDLPATTGFVPAFWLLPADNIYDWWPNSGEIDIMEQPTNQPSTIYGTVHTEAYNFFSGTIPPGDTIHVPDAQTTFHLYAVEWTPNQIDFYVDGQNYFSFSNDHSGSATWPFDKPFFIILNVAVGGGWCGPPNSTTVFPAIMEVDYVRVYQYFDDIGVNGTDFTPYFSSNNSYSVPDIASASYAWEVPGNAQIVSGQNTNQIEVDWNYFGGDVNAQVTTSTASQTINFPVKVSNNLLKNGGFEKGVKYWNEISHVYVDWNLDTNTVFYGNQSLSADVQTLGSNPWDIQFSQKDIYLQAGEEYILRFWARTDNTTGDINVAFVGLDPFIVYYGDLFQLTNNWTQYEINYTATTTDTVALNIDLGFQTGIYYLDNFILTTPELLNANQIQNADFFDADSNWNLVTLSGAQATGSVIEGEYSVSITNGGSNIWDVHLGQSGINAENGQEYTVSFDAYAASPRNIYALVGKNSDPWTVYAGQTFAVTTTKQTYSYTFIMNEPSDSQARFGFDIGGSTTDLYFDNIRISPGTNPSVISEPETVPQSIELFQNYPNPFNPTTKIKFEIPKSENVKIEVFNMIGQKVGNLLNKQMPSGSHEVEFIANDLPNGVYLYRIEAGDPSTGSGQRFQEVKKMILIK